MTRVLILNPPTPSQGYINRDLMGGMGVYTKFEGGTFAKLFSLLKNSYVRIPVVQLVYAATLLEKNGFELKIIDAANEDLTTDFVINESEKFNPDYILMAVSSSGIIFERDIVAASLKKKTPHAKIIAVGDMISEMPELITPWFDIAIVGEVETNIIDICKDENVEKSGLIINNNGHVIKTKPANRLPGNELDNLPFPAWHLFPYQKYRYYPMVTKTPVATIQASRGCPYGCGYCPYTKNQGKPWRARSAENIFQEILHDVNLGFKGFFFRDPLFTLDIKRVDQLCTLIIEKNLDIGFAFETRPELLNATLIKKLHHAGCTSINFGIEDIHPDILKNISRKPLDTTTILNTVHSCEREGIRTSCFFILGLPGSTRETIEETIAFSKKLFASQVEYKVATPYPGTDLYHLAKKNNWLISESFDMLTGYRSSMQISPDLSPEYLEKKTRHALSTYYLAPKYLFREIIRGRIFSNLYFALKYSAL